MKTLKTTTQNLIWLVADSLNILEEASNYGFKKIGESFKKKN